jgi:hypothetical protein
VSYIRAFVMFWVDFIIGDAWEVAAGIVLALVALGLAAHQWDGNAVLGFLLLVVIVCVTWLALMRATASARQH